MSRSRYSPHLGRLPGPLEASRKGYISRSTSLLHPPSRSTGSSGSEPCAALSGAPPSERLRLLPCENALNFEKRSRNRTSQRSVLQLEALTRCAAELLFERRHKCNSTIAAPMNPRSRPVEFCSLKSSSSIYASFLEADLWKTV